MTRPPNIVVQMVHIQGPLKGEIQEFSQPLILVGRHPSCQVRFPADLTIMSRKHAEIVREGNRFKLVDHSTNGTFVNGKRLRETYLKEGDVLAFAEGGPKVSFLTKIKEESIEAQETLPPAQVQSSFASEPEPQEAGPQEISLSPPEPKRESEIIVQKAQAPVIIQYGPTLLSFKETPITIGKTPNCDFVLDHPSVLDRHVQIFFHQNQYWIKDLTGQGMALVNRQSINLQVPLGSNDELALSPEGPFFRFLGGGRLAEIQETPQEAPPSSGVPVGAEKTPHQGTSQEETPGKPLSKLKKLFRH